MHLKFITWALTLAGLLLSSGALGGETPERGLVDASVGPVALEARAYIHYWYQLQDSAVEEAGAEEPGANSFQLARMYFGFKARMNQGLLLKFTADVGPEKSVTTSETQDHSHEVKGSTRIGLFVKYAYLEQALPGNLNLQAGVLPVQIDGLASKMWGHRYLIANFGDKEGLWYSADLGAQVNWTLPSGLGVMGLSVFNGSGYKNALDRDPGKQVSHYMWLSPLAGLGSFFQGFKLGSMVQYDMPLGSAPERFLVTGLIGYQGPAFTLFYQLAADMGDLGDDVQAGLGHVGYLRIGLPLNLELFSRVVLFEFDPDGAEGLTRFETASGISSQVRPGLNLALSGITVKLDGPGHEGEETDLRVMLGSEIWF